jgi:hypothetical protein
MVQFSQIYEKSVRKVLTFFGLVLLLNSCATKSTSLFELQNQSALQEAQYSATPIIEIEKKSVYILGIFTTGEYDRFEGNIFDQLRISLYSEARYKYPEYKLTNVSQEESYRFFKTTYSVKGQLVSDKQIRERLNLMSGVLAEVPSSEADETPANIVIPEEVEAVEAADQEPDVDVASTEEVVEMLEEVIKEEPSEIAEPVAIIEEPSKITEPAAIVEELQIEEEPSSTLIEEEPIAVVENIQEAEQEEVQPSAPIAIQEEIIEAPKLEASPLMGKTVYIVACFQRQGFAKEKVEITQAEVGFPLAYYKTDKWIRVYLDGEFNNVIEAKEVFDDAWPIQYGR